MSTDRKVDDLFRQHRRILQTIGRWLELPEKVQQESAATAPTETGIRATRFEPLTCVTDLQRPLCLQMVGRGVYGRPTANTWLGWDRHDARPGSRGHRAGAVADKQRRGRGGRGGPAVLLPGDRGGPLRLDQDLTCSAVLSGVALLLSHRDHEPPCEASEVPDQELVRLNRYRSAWPGQKPYNRRVQQRERPGAALKGFQQRSTCANDLHRPTWR
jgi:hypothetical protein